MFFACADESTRINLLNRLVKIKTPWRRRSTGIEKALRLIRISSKEQASDIVAFCLHVRSSAGINLLFLLAIKIEDLKRNDEAFRISECSNCIAFQSVVVLVIQLNALLGKKGRSLRDLTDYWDVATYFELHAVQGDWTKACLAALHMYLLNPPIWYMKSTINNLKMLHQATRLRDQQKLREESATSNGDESVYSFWIDFFTDAIHSTSNSGEDNELPAQIPVSPSEQGRCSSNRSFL